MKVLLFVKTCYETSQILQNIGCPDEAYSCSDPNCSDSPLEYDNSRLSLDENCHILEENYTNLVSFFSNSRVRITGEIHILCQRLQELLFSK